VDPGIVQYGSKISMVLPSNIRDYYFGNIDSFHLVFSRGILQAQSDITSESESRQITKERTYSIQNFHEEAKGLIDNYNSLWTDITVSGIF